MNHQYKTIEELSHDLNVAMERTDILKKELQAQHDMFNALLNVLSSNGLITQQEWFDELIRLRRDDPAEETD